FFGDQHYTTDFLYQVEWQRWLKDGVLTRMDVAFSRDTDEKVYVQHKMLENSRDLFQWVEEGAVVYVCGDEKHMATDVHQTLVDIIETEGKMNSAEANDYLAQMQQQKRYQRDVYSAKVERGLRMTKKVTLPPQTGELSDVESIKRESNYLRGTLQETMEDPITAGIPDDDNRLLKFHGSYLQDDRDL